MSEYIKRMDTFSDEMCEGIDCGVCPFYNKAGENDCQVVAFLRSIPAADVRPVVRGRWIETKTGFHCSACKAKAKGTKDGALLSNFCPNCGADMREES